MSVRPIQTTRLTGAGNIKASKGTLNWINVSNTSASTKVVVLNNATSGSGSEIMQIGVLGSDSQFRSFSPGFYFSTGIRCGTLGAGLIVTGAYE